MGRAIDADALKEEIDYYIREAGWGETHNETLRWCLEFINNQHTIEPERKKGKWIMKYKGSAVTSYKCSECGRTVKDDTGYDVSKDYPFCHCGADMREEQDDNNIHASVGPAIMPSGDHG